MTDAIAPRSTLPALTVGNLVEMSQRAGAIGVVFPLTRAASSVTAASMSAAAVQHWRLELDGKPWQCALFGTTPAQFSIARMVVWHVARVKGGMAFGAGLPLANLHKTVVALDCAAAAAACHDHRAHCHLVLVQRETFDTLHAAGVDIPIPVSSYTSTVENIGPGDDAYTAPCRLLVRAGFRPQPRHPSSPADQLQAAAVREGMQWCPFFKP